LSRESFGKSVHRFFRDYLAVIGTGNPLGRLMRRATHDQDARRRLVSNPREVLTQAGVKLPPDLRIEILENTDRRIHVVLPPFIESMPKTEESR